MQNDALMSYSAGGAFTVFTGDATMFENINGLSGLAAAGTPNLIARGLVFKNVLTGKPDRSRRTRSGTSGWAIPESGI